jgi:hypothetical protein
MPRAVEMLDAGLGHARDVELLQELVERHPKEVVELGPADLAVAHLVHVDAFAAGDRQPGSRARPIIAELSATLTDHEPPLASRRPAR